MKNKNALRFLFAAIFGLFIFAGITHAQEVVPVAAPAVSANNLVQWLTPLVVPLILAGLKKVLPSLPSALIPLLAPVLGVILDLANHLATGHTTNLVVALGLGLLGVGVREVKEAIKPAANGGWTVVDPNQ